MKDRSKRRMRERKLKNYLKYRSTSKKMMKK